VIFSFYFSKCWACSQDFFFSLRICHRSAVLKSISFSFFFSSAVFQRCPFCLRFHATRTLFFFFQLGGSRPRPSLPLVSFFPPPPRQKACLRNFMAYQTFLSFTLSFFDAAPFFFFFWVNPMNFFPSNQFFPASFFPKAPSFLFQSQSVTAPPTRGFLVVRCLIRIWHGT